MLSHLYLNKNFSRQLVFYIFSLNFTFIFHTIPPDCDILEKMRKMKIEGSACNNYFLYEDAIKYLNEAIKIQSSEKEAYRERAFSYFELNKIDLALKDYYIDSLYAMGEFLAHAKIYKLLENALPDLRECREYWDTWSDYMKGQKMGFIIGKYSIAAFYYVTAWKGTSYYNRLRRANIMATLERCSVSKGTRILEESAKRASKNTLRLKKAFNGTVIPHNPNVVPHVMQKKHRWDKHIRLSGNRFENIKTYFYRKKMEKDTIVAMFDVNKKGMPLLKNAWVEPNPPFTP